MDPILSPSSSSVSSAVIDQLARTKGWTLFFSVLLWIGFGFCIIGGLVLLGIGIFAGTLGNEMAEDMGGAIAMVPLGLLYLVLAAVYIYPALKLGRFSSRISELMNQPNEAVLVSALNEQRAFWKYVGIWMIVFIVLYPVFIIAAIAIPAISAAGGGM